MIVDFKINESYNDGVSFFIYNQNHCDNKMAMFFLLSDNFHLNKNFVMNGRIHHYNKIGVQYEDGKFVNFIWVSVDSKQNYSNEGIHFFTNYNDSDRNDIKDGLLKYGISSKKHIYIINGAFGESGCIYEDIIKVFGERKLNGYHLTDKPFYSNKNGFIYDFGLTVRWFLSLSILHKLPKKVYDAKSKDIRFVFSIRKMTKYRKNFIQTLLKHNLLNNSKFLVTLSNLIDDSIYDDRFLIIDETNSGLSFSNNLIKEACFVKKLRDIGFIGQIELLSESNNVSDNDIKVPDGNYLTEKTFNMIYNEIPFLLVSNHCHSILKNVGIDYYSDVWDIDYNQTDFNSHLLDRIEKLCNLSDIEFENLLKKAEDIAKQNYIRFLELVYNNPIPKILNLYN